MAKLTLKGNTLFDGATAVLKAADSRGQVLLQTIVDNPDSETAPKSFLKYEEATKSWVDAKYKHVLFVLNKEKSDPVLKSYLSEREAPKTGTEHVNNLEHAMTTDGGVAVKTNEENFVNLTEEKDQGKVK